MPIMHGEQSHMQEAEEMIAKMAGLRVYKFKFDIPPGRRRHRRVDANAVSTRLAARIAKIPYSVRIPLAYSPYSDNKVFRTYKTEEGTALCDALFRKSGKRACTCAKSQESSEHTRGAHNFQLERVFWL